MPAFLLSVVLLTLAPTAPPADDLVPVAVEALLAQPDDPFFFGLPVALDAEALLEVFHVGVVRTLAELPDVTGDGRSEVVAGVQPGTSSISLSVRDGVSGALLWGSSPDGGGFRGMHCVDVSGGQVLSGASSLHGQLTVQDGGSGALCWRRWLVPSGSANVVNISMTRWVDDMDGDGLADVALAAGRGFDGAGLLSGTDGSTLWMHLAGDVVYDMVAAGDHDGDGRSEWLIVGGDEAPFARLLAGSDGSPLWSVPLDGPGAVAMALDDLDGDGLPELAVGQWNAPGSCLLCLRGADGSRRWEAGDVSFDVTSLAPLGDLQQTGFHDLAVGSFDNAVSGVLAFNGVSEWRREGSTNNTGAMLSVVALGDLDQSGLPELGTVSMDHRFYLLGGELGQFMARYDLGQRGSVVARMSDQDGDGRPEVLVGGVARLALIDGAAGLASGPWLTLRPATHLEQEGAFTLWVYPATHYDVYASLGTGSIDLPAWKSPFLLDPATVFLVASGSAPGAGAVGFSIPPFPPSLAGITFYMQAAQAFAPGDGWISNLVSMTVPRR